MEFIGFHVGLWIEISGFEPKSGHCVAFFDRSLSFHKIPFHSGVFMDSGKMCLKLLGGGRREEGRRMVSVIICKGVEVTLCNFAQMSILLAL